MATSIRAILSQLRDTIMELVTGNDFIGREQTDIDDLIETELSEWGTLVDDIGDIPTGARQRKRTFWTHQDALRYIRDAGIPADYVFFLSLPDYDEVGNTAYVVFIQET